jgi:hypothetical protein
MKIRYSRKSRISRIFAVAENRPLGFDVAARGSSLPAAWQFSMPAAQSN